MRIQTITRLTLMSALAGTLLTTPALAQGKGKGKEKEQARPELVRREQELKRRQKALDAEYKARQQALKRQEEARREQLRRERERLDERRRDDRYDDDRWEDYGDWDDDARGRQGPPFCRNGQGHPVHGRRWCEERGFGRDGVLLNRRDGRYDSRYPSDGRYGSYEQAHEEFHRWHDRECRMRAAERPLDLQWQLRVRRECAERHDEWHYRAGRRHS